jgi:DNA-binding IclR family transcriptional regulator
VSQKPSYPVGSAGNVLILLRLLCERGELRVSDAAEHLGVGASTAHRLLAMLKYQEFAVQDGHRAYRPGPGLAILGAVSPVHPDLRVLARPQLEKLRGTVKETTQLIVLVGNGARFVDGVEATQSLRVGVRVGLLLPAHLTSGGKALLAELPYESLQALYPRGIPNTSERGVHTLPELVRQLTVVRRRGYAKNVAESDRGVAALGACVRDDSGRALAAVTIGFPRSRARSDTMRDMAVELLRTAGEVSAAIQH